MPELPQIHSTKSQRIASGSSPSSSRKKLMDVIVPKNNPTILVCRNKWVPCPNTFCSAYATYSINNYVKSLDGSEDSKLYDMFTSLYSDSVTSFYSSELVCQCRSATCAINRKDFRLPLLGSLCPDCPEKTACVVSVYGFMNYNRQNVVDYLTGENLKSVIVSLKDTQLSWVDPMVREYGKPTKELQENSVQFVVISMCLKRKHVFCSTYSCQHKKCCFPTTMSFDKSFNRYLYRCSGPRKDHQSFALLREIHPGTGVEELSLDPCFQRHDQLKCPLCLTAGPIVIPKNSSASTNFFFICSQTRCRLMWY